MVPSLYKEIENGNWAPLGGDEMFEGWAEWIVEIPGNYLTLLYLGYKHLVKDQNSGSWVLKDLPGGLTSDRWHIFLWKKEIVYLTSYNNSYLTEKTL